MLSLEIQLPYKQLSPTNKVVATIGRNIIFSEVFNKEEKRSNKCGAHNMTSLQDVYATAFQSDPNITIPKVNSLIN